MSKRKLDWTAFVQKNGRVPMITDKSKPWHFRGWLLYYLLLAEDLQKSPQRWGYWFRTMSAGHLLDEPIPPLSFDLYQSGERTAGYKMIDKCAMAIHQEGRSLSAIRVFLDWLLYGLAESKDSPELSEETNEWLYRNFSLEPFLDHPHDYIGEWIALHKGKWNDFAFYPTPHSVVQMMVEINFAGIPPAQARLERVLDPCMGSGRMLLHSSSHSLLLYGCDIDPVVIRASKVNAMLYAPWLARPFPQHVLGVGGRQGIELRDSIRDPPAEG